MVHFSTDYVFDGAQRSPYTESDLPCPLNVYGVSKLAGEHMLRLTWERHFVVCTCGLYGVAGSSGKGGNFVETMLKKANEGAPIRVVDDQVLTPTNRRDAERIHQLADCYGIHDINDRSHVVSRDECALCRAAAKRNSILAPRNPDERCMAMDLREELGYGWKRAFVCHERYKHCERCGKFPARRVAGS